MTILSMSIALLKSELLNYSHRVIDLVLENKKKGSIRKTKRTYIRTEFSRFVYNRGLIDWTSEKKHFRKEEWSSEDQSKLEEIAKGEPAYQRIIQLVIELFPKHKEGADFCLSAFLSEIIRLGLDKEKTEENELVGITSSFIDDLEGKPNLWTPKTWLSGIWLDDETVIVSKELSFRRPEPNDIEPEYPLDMSGFYLRTMPPLLTSAIMETKLQAHYPVEVQKALEKTLIGLRLCKLGSVEYIRYRLNPRSIIAWSGTFSSGLDTSPAYKYGIGKKHSVPLNRFLSRMLDLIPEDCLLGAIPKDHISISLTRYNDALLKPERAEGRITFAVMSLEAL